MKHIGKPVILESVSKDIADKLKIKEDEKVVLTKKLFYADESPCVFCIDYFPLKLLSDEANLERIDDYDNSLFDYFKFEVRKQVTSDQVEITTTTSEETEILEKYFPDDVKSFLQLNCINFDEEGEAMIYAKEYIDTDLIRFFSLRRK